MGEKIFLACIMVFAFMCILYACRRVGYSDEKYYNHIKLFDIQYLIGSGQYHRIVIDIPKGVFYYNIKDPIDGNEPSGKVNKYWALSAIKKSNIGVWLEGRRYIRGSKGVGRWSIVITLEDDSEIDYMGVLEDGTFTRETPKEMQYLIEDLESICKKAMSV